ncbi:MAG TPA: hypothetical protein VM869_15960 [Enhygromyxa sp.]|nr:hypothetical protein [Enhygromyxa sp.]
MRKLSSLIAGACLTLTAGLVACVDVDSDPFDSLTTNTTNADNDTTGDGDGDGDGDTGDGDGDTGDGDGDGTGDGDGDGDACGEFGDPCNGTTCCAGLACGADGTCGIGGGDGDGDGDGDTPMWGEGPYYGAPPNCQPDEVPLMDGQLPVAGGHCSPVAMCTDAQCTNMDACPPAPEGSTAQGAILWADQMMNSYCGLLCMVAADPTQCPAGATCKDLMNPQAPGYGACTYP